MVHELWELTDPLPGRFRASAFEYRPYPGTPDWHRLLATGRYSADQLLKYSAVDLTSDGVDESMRERDEFNFSVNLPLAEAPIDYVRAQLVALSRAVRPQGQRGMTGTYVGSWRVFVTLDGMGGPGSPPRRHLHQDLTAAGYTVHVTAQPSDDRLGEIARHGTDIYTGTPSPAWWPPTATTTSPGNPSAARGWPNRAM